jgi:5-(carboxyamino)imidazole ribonucleotide synthase
VTTAPAPATILPPSTLGVVGGGQLGRMFVQAAHALGYRTAVLTPQADGPAAQVAGTVIPGAPDDLGGLRRLAATCAAVTVEFENVSAAGLRWLARRVPVRPGWRSIRVAQDRIREKTTLARIGAPLPGWAPVRTADDLARAPAPAPLGLILKTAASGYDGKGQVRVKSADGLPDAWERLGRVPCVVEEVVDFAVEVSCVLARSADGSTAAFPVFWNRHRRHILDVTVAPAPIGPAASLEAVELAARIASALDHVGLLTVELFVTRDGRLLVNELAPRPHNSGHLTLEAAAVSQFGQQVRALCGLPLGSGRLVSPAAMVNLLGDLWEPGPPRWDALLRLEPDAALHLYGKASARGGRKMGHLTICDTDPLRAADRALAAREALRAPSP